MVSFCKNNLDEAIEYLNELVDKAHIWTRPSATESTNKSRFAGNPNNIPTTESKDLEEDQSKSGADLPKEAEDYDIRAWQPKFEELLKKSEKQILSSMKTPRVELKSLPKGLKPDFLGSGDTFPIIISSELSESQVKDKYLIPVVDELMDELHGTKVFSKLDLSHGVRADLEKIKALLSWPPPKYLKALRGFLGLTSYYRRFVKGYGAIAATLTSFLKRDSFTWDEEAQTTFDKLKTTMTEPPVLALPNFQKPFVVECDTSREAIGDFLSSSNSDEVEIIMSRNCPEVEDDNIEVEIEVQQCDMNVEDFVIVGDEVDVRDGVDVGDGVTVEDLDQVVED
ncbi:uncharacterized protein LOC121235441 [Juglans microcarpa x Juglans regia]|uniref:uncharacterized protein LOC121235441 n=1 Tax=Juglans microcarpa x Juglans regia TaxID=2249226 RepID=UPI001B7F78B7|nr:uncharacterized protein LOC121235441 [Juglans microcarpa x Juglans regia]